MMNVETLKTVALETQEIAIRRQYPADWWEAFKDRWFPGWALKRWPVRR